MFKLVSALLDLPFTIIGLLWKSFKLMLGPVRKYVWLAIWYSVYFFLLKPQRLLYLAALLIISVVGLVIAFTNNASDEGLPPLPGVNGQKAQNKAPIKQTPLSYGSVAELPVIKGTLGNGNSKFSTPLLETMDPMDVQTYSSYFYYAMSNATADKPYRWIASPALFGEIIAGEAFKSSSGAQCRRFTELLSYQGRGERFKGAACQRDARNWCRLRNSAALTCGIDKPSGTLLFLKKYF